MRKSLLNWLYHLQPLVPFYQGLLFRTNYHFVCNTTIIQNSVVKCLLAVSFYLHFVPKFVKRHLGTTAKGRKKNQKIYDTNFTAQTRPLHTANLDRVNLIQECLPPHYF